MNRRAAKSLIEMVTVMAVFSVVMLLGARMLALIFRADAAGGQGVAVSHTLARMAQQFRRDAHAAVSAQLEHAEADEAAADEESRLILSLADGNRAVWTAAADHVVRTLTGDAGPVANETYQLPRGRNTFEITGNQEMVVLTHVRMPATGQVVQSPHAVRVAALRGRDLRFVSSDAAGGED